MSIRYLDIVKNESENKSNKKIHSFEFYKELIGYIKHEETQFWSRNQVFLAINAAMLTLLGLTQRQQGCLDNISGYIINGALCFFGFIISILWFVIIHRSESFYNHWYEQLKYIENRDHYHLKIFNMADSYFDSGRVLIGKNEFRLSPIAKCLRIFLVVRIISIMVAVIWIALGVYFVSIYIF